MAGKKMPKWAMIAIVLVSLTICGAIGGDGEAKLDASAPSEASVAAPQTVEPAAPEVEAREVAAAGLIPATVVRVIDGDTAEFMVDGVKERVRFIGVDTPESTNQIEPYGKEASAHTAEILAVGREVFLERDVEERDRYGRLLAYVWLSEPLSLNDGDIRTYLLNAQLALDGYAQQMTIQPNSKYAEYFTNYVAEAREDERGLWAPGVVEAAAPAKTPIATPSTPAKTSTTTTSKSTTNSTAVYITRTGEKYHSDGCSSLSKSKIPTTLKQAIADGYTPCSKCSPPR